MFETQTGLDIYKLPRPEFMICVGKLGLQLDGAGRHVDGIVNELQFARHVLSVAVFRDDLKRVLRIVLPNLRQ